MIKDGLFLLSQDPSIIKGYELAILTPNINEFGRLCDAVKVDPKGEKPLEDLCDRLVVMLNYITIRKVWKYHNC
jgi:ATP-dependent NAD(P)H-hydrate dehydratase